MQLLYQLDLIGEIDVGRNTAGEHDPPEVRESAKTLALRAWECHRDADKIIAALAPKWPTSRQPPVDRAILRLAYHEITSGRAPIRVVLNEAVELAKVYSTEQSASFINGVLDKAARQLKGSIPLQPASSADAESDASSKSSRKTDLWLKDARDPS